MLRFLKWPPELLGGDSGKAVKRLDKIPTHPKIFSFSSADDESRRNQKIKSEPQRQNDLKWDFFGFDEIEKKFESCCEHKKVK